MVARVEVVVSFAGTTLATALVASHQRFVIGATRDADFALDVPVPFAVVEGAFVRAAADAIPVRLHGPVALTFGHVTLRIAPATAAGRLPRAEIDRRAVAYGGGSLLAHVALLGVATWLATPETTAVGVEEARARPTMVARFAAEAQTVKREDRPAPPVAPVTADDTPTPNPMLDDLAIATKNALEANGLGADTDERAVESTGTSHDDEPRSFDPDANAAFETVKVGELSTVSTGTAAGASFRLVGENGNRRPVIVISCDAASCLILGGDPASGIREALEARLASITGCYEQHASSAGKKVELDFGIDGDGKIERVEVGGVGDYDSCVADVIEGIEL